jgi:hypothetical protein
MFWNSQGESSAVRKIHNHQAETFPSLVRTVHAAYEIQPSRAVCLGGCVVLTLRTLDNAHLPTIETMLGAICIAEPTNIIWALLPAMACGLITKRAIFRC